MLEKSIKPQSKITEHIEKQTMEQLDNEQQENEKKAKAKEKKNNEKAKIEKVVNVVTKIPHVATFALGATTGLIPKILEEMAKGKNK